MWKDSAKIRNKEPPSFAGAVSDEDLLKDAEDSAGALSGVDVAIESQSE